MSGQGVPEKVKSRVLGLHEDNVQLREQLKTVQDKLNKARAVRPSFSFYYAFFSVCSSSSNRRISSLRRSKLDYEGFLHL